MKKIFAFFFIFINIFLLSQRLDFTAIDNPNDNGSAVLLNWKIEYTDSLRFILEKSIDAIEFEKIQQLDKSEGQFVDGQDIEPGKEVFYNLKILSENGDLIAISEVSAIPKAQWFNTDKISLLIMVLILSISIIYFIFSAKSGKELYIRKIAGLESMDESVGRATEMGRPILYIPGTLDLDDMQTIAGLTILGKLAQKAAEYNADLIVPVCRSMVLSTAKEIVKESYLKAGRPDAYKPDSVFYLTDDQFGYVAGVDGIIMREKPAANFYLGAFYAESLILAETGFATGAIQTSGTAMPSQLPFFVVACDYTLIGEELFAASAYLSKEPHQLGSLKGQDVGKAIFVIVVLLGIVLEIAGFPFIKDFLTIH
ncbi:MAG: hypothetical protein H8E57_06965 [Candidatus Cloacimonetes bacterium]|nr:hypothetical protein [Candidatus Cloacimonadota bacterium]